MTLIGRKDALMKAKKIIGDTIWHKEKRNLSKLTFLLLKRAGVIQELWVSKMHCLYTQIIF